jgi:DNA-binding HxlR family transcriptional regulator
LSPVGAGRNRNGYRARAGALTLLYLISIEERETLCRMLAQIEGGLFDPDVDLDAPPLEAGGPPDGEEPSEAEAAAFGSEPFPDPDLVAAPGEVPESEASADSPEVGPDTPMRTTPAGEEMVVLAQLLEGWLRDSPAGEMRLGEEEAGFALITMVSGWVTTVTHRLAAAPLTIDELQRETGALRREALEGQVEAMRLAGLVEALDGPDGETRYGHTEWGRRAIAMLVAGARHERRRRDEDTAPPDALDVGAAFQLALPLVELPPDVSGTCRAGVQMPGEGIALVGANVRVEAGRVVAADPELDPWPDNYATGSPLDWMNTIFEPAADKLKTGGDTRLARALIEGLHESLFGGPLPSPEDILNRR